METNNKYFTLSDCLGSNEIKVYTDRDKLIAQFDAEMNSRQDATENDDFYEWCIKNVRYDTTN